MLRSIVCQQPQTSLLLLQTNVHSLSTMAGLLRQHANLTSIRKIGEGTFGEAYKADQVLLPTEAQVFNIILGTLSGSDVTQATDLCGKSVPDITGGVTLQYTVRCPPKCDTSCSKQNGSETWNHFEALCSQAAATLPRIGLATLETSSLSLHLIVCASLTA